jgi:hypothetical protein
LLVLDLRQQQLFPTVRTVHLAWAKLRRQAITFLIEQQQRVKAGGLEVPVEGTLLLLPIDRNLGRIQVQHRSVVPVDGFRLPDQLPVDPSQTREVLLLRQHLRLEGL